MFNEKRKETKKDIQIKIEPPENKDCKKINTNSSLMTVIDYLDKVVVLSLGLHGPLNKEVYR